MFARYIDRELLNLKYWCYQLLLYEFIHYKLYGNNGEELLKTNYRKHTRLNQSTYVGEGDIQIDRIICRVI